MNIHTTQGIGADMGLPEMGYALSKQVPAMRETGFEIGTTHGSIHVLPSPLADRIAELIESHIRIETGLARRRELREIESQPERPR